MSKQITGALLLPNLQLYFEFWVGETVKHCASSLERMQNAAASQWCSPSAWHGCKWQHEQQGNQAKINTNITSLQGWRGPSLQIFLHRKRPTELHCSRCQPGLPAVMTHFLYIWATVDFCKCCLTLLTSHTHPLFAEPGWSGCLVSQSFISRSLEDALSFYLALEGTTET